MNLSKAIEIVGNHQIVLKTTRDHDFFTALCLLIEASRYIVRSRVFGEFPVNHLLPSETPE